MHDTCYVCYIYCNNVYYPIYREFGGSQTCFVPFYACASYKYIHILTVIILNEFLFNKLLSTHVQVPVFSDVSSVDCPFSMSMFLFWLDWFLMCLYLYLYSMLILPE